MGIKKLKGIKEDMENHDFQCPERFRKRERETVCICGYILFNACYME